MSGSPRAVLGAVALVAAALSLNLDANRASAQSGEPTPLVRVAPQYPPRALQRGRSGHVTLRFTIAADGRTKDIEVVESSSSVFEDAAVAALSQWRYAPHIANGTAVERPGVQTTIQFAVNR